MIAAQCYLIDMDHGIERDKLICQQQNTVARITIGNDCWLGANVSILKGSRIGDGAVIGAKALVKGDVPPYAVAVGVPGKVIKYRKND